MIKLRPSLFQAQDDRERKMQFGLWKAGGSRSYQEQSNESKMECAVIHRRHGAERSGSVRGQDRSGSSKRYFKTKPSKKKKIQEHCLEKCVVRAEAV